MAPAASRRTLTRDAVRRVVKSRAVVKILNTKPVRGLLNRVLSPERRINMDGSTTFSMVTPVSGSFSEVDEPSNLNIHVVSEPDNLSVGVIIEPSNPTIDDVNESVSYAQFICSLDTETMRMEIQWGQSAQCVRNVFGVAENPVVPFDHVYTSGGQLTIDRTESSHHASSKDELTTDEADSDNAISIANELNTDRVDADDRASLCTITVGIVLQVRTLHMPSDAYNPSSGIGFGPGGLAGFLGRYRFSGDASDGQYQNVTPNVDGFGFDSTGMVDSEWFNSTNADMFPDHRCNNPQYIIPSAILDRPMDHGEAFDFSAGANLQTAGSTPIMEEQVHESIEPTSGVAWEHADNAALQMSMSTDTTSTELRDSSIYNQQDNMFDEDLYGNKRAHEDSDSEYEDSSPTSKKSKINKNGQPRKVRQSRGALLKWDFEDFVKALNGIVWACGQLGIQIPFEMAAQVVSENCTAGALQQAILKSNQRLRLEGHQMPKLSMNWLPKDKDKQKNVKYNTEPKALPRRKPTLSKGTQTLIVKSKVPYVEEKRVHLPAPFRGLSTHQKQARRRPKQQSERDCIVAKEPAFEEQQEIAAARCAEQQAFRVQNRPRFAHLREPPVFNLHPPGTLMDRQAHSFDFSNAGHIPVDQLRNLDVDQLPNLDVDDPAQYAPGFGFAPANDPFADREFHEPQFMSDLVMTDFNMLTNGSFQS